MTSGRTCSKSIYAQIQGTLWLQSNLVWWDLCYNISRSNFPLLISLQELPVQKPSTTVWMNCDKVGIATLVEQPKWDHLSWNIVCDNRWKMVHVFPQGASTQRFPQLDVAALYFVRGISLPWILHVVSSWAHITFSIFSLVWEGHP